MQVTIYNIIAFSFIKLVLLSYIRKFTSYFPDVSTNDDIIRNIITKWNKNKGSFYKEEYELGWEIEKCGLEQKYDYIIEYEFWLKLKT